MQSAFPGSDNFEKEQGNDRKSVCQEKIFLATIFLGQRVVLQEAYPTLVAQALQICIFPMDKVAPFSQRPESSGRRTLGITLPEPGGVTHPFSPRPHRLDR
jgi:hypothetical protein